MAKPLNMIRDSAGLSYGHMWDRDAFDDHADMRLREWLGPRLKSELPRVGIDACGGDGFHALERLKMGIVDTMVVCDINDQQTSVDKKQQEFLRYYDFFLDNHASLPDRLAMQHRFLVTSQSVTGHPPSLRFMPDNIVNLTPDHFAGSAISFLVCRNGFGFIAPEHNRNFLGFCAANMASEAPVILSFASTGSDKFPTYSIMDDRSPDEFYAHHVPGHPPYGFYRRDEVCTYMQDLGFTIHDEQITTTDIYDPKHGEKIVKIGESCILARAPKKQPGIRADGMHCV